MPDMLVQLLKLPPIEPLISEMRENGVIIRRAMAHEISRVRGFVERTFSIAWADEITVAYSNKPVSLFIAFRDGDVIGFAAYETTRRGFFGPTGVAPTERGKYIGKALLLASLWGLREMGYVYGIIGGAGPIDFYAKHCGATVIPESEPGIYADPLKKPTAPT
jgi:predicted N-acetyltransferase YhbS